MGSYPATTETRFEPGANRLTPEAFGEAFDSCSRALWCIAAAILGHRDGVEDVLQEGAVVALGKLDQFDRGTSFLAWMGQIVRYVALNHARRRRRAPARSVQPGALEALAVDAPRYTPPPTACGQLPPDQAWFDDEVLAALRSLDATARACLLLRTMMDLPYRDISLALDIPEGTAMSHVHRSRRSMRDQLRDRIGAAASEGTDP